MKSAYSKSKNKKGFLAFISSILFHLILIAGASIFVMLKLPKNSDAIKFESNKRPPSLNVQIKKIPVNIKQEIKPLEMEYIPVKTIVQMPKILIPDVSVEMVDTVEMIEIEDNTLFDDITVELTIPSEEIKESLDLSSPTTPLFQPKPEFPYELRDRGVSGEVLIQFVINKEGRTSEIKIIKTTHPAFSKSSVDAIKKWRYESREEEVIIQVPISFIDE